MELKNYIELLGDEVAAQLFEVKPRTTASWRRGERLPRPSQALVIVERTNGKVSLKDIYK
jgi:hypothetical protein